MSEPTDEMIEAGLRERAEAPAIVPDERERLAQAKAALDKFLRLFGAAAVVAVTYRLIDFVWPIASIPAAIVVGALIGVASLYVERLFDE